MICNVKELLEYAKINNCAVGAFNVSNLEMIIGVVKAAEDTNSNIILQIAESRLKYTQLNLIAAAMVEAAKKSKIKIAVQLDHAQTFAIIEEALDLGFSSIMYDGSHLPLEENIKNTNLVEKMTSKYKASLEGELGIIRGNEGNIKHNNSIYTSLQDAIDFEKNTNVNCLAIAIGNAHGIYLEKPKLNFELLKNISSSINTPLVLHGGSGISYEEFRYSINNGIRKINIATANFQAVIDASKNYFEKEEKYNFFSLTQNIIENVYKVTKKHIEVFNNKKPLEQIEDIKYE